MACRISECMMSLQLSSRWGMSLQVVILRYAENLLCCLLGLDFLFLHLLFWQDAKVEDMIGSLSCQASKLAWLTVGAKPRWPG